MIRPVAVRDEERGEIGVKRDGHTKEQNPFSGGASVGAFERSTVNGGARATGICENEISAGYSVGMGKSIYDGRVRILDGGRIADAKCIIV